jgi:hypothetical protein
MRIGIDFDNTIVSYDSLFHSVAVERQLLPVETPMRKLAIRDYLRGVGREQSWTEMQGHVYGARMCDARAYPGAIEFVRRAREGGHSIAIISHKTRWPFAGEQHDLHAAARSWIERHLGGEGIPLVPPELVFFELTQDEKLARIGELHCDVFIDDLPEILLSAAFPPKARPLLFDPDAQYEPVAASGLGVHRSWSEIAAALHV